MSFEVEVHASVRDRIRSWNLSQDVERQFYILLIDEFQSTSVYKNLIVSEGGMELQLTIEATPQRFYTFKLQLNRDDMSFQLLDCSCVCTEDGVVIWSSEDD